MAKYDPDGDPAAFDINDLEMVEGWLDSPVASACAEDLGRAFAASPLAEQLKELGLALVAAEARRDEVAVAVAGVQADDPRHRLLDGFNSFAENLRGSDR
ncbi:hypothetical protein ACFPIJ_54030 [Dactylosporangium cerinum]|uniref:Uncharacterized protein n=1 Tax=Dactylosporangium cerinum TaxID=1434730 RepID=A0ABV9WE55_9ACTN